MQTNRVGGQRPRIDYMSPKQKMEALRLSDDFEPYSGAALFYAAAYGKTKMLKEIITKNGNAVHYRNSRKQTPLHIAAYRGHMDSVTALVSANAPLEAKDEVGDTPLICAIIGNDESCPVGKYLIENGSDVNARNNNGSTPLHFAVGRDAPRPAKVFSDKEEEKHGICSCCIII